MAIAFVNSHDDTNLSSGTSRAFALGFNPAAGECLAVCIFWKNNVTITSVTDTLSNTYADCGAGRLTRPTDGFLQIFGAQVTTGGTTPTITVSFSGAMVENENVVLDYSGQDQSTLFDVTATGTATSGTSVTTGSFTPGVTDGAVVAWCVTNDTNGSAGTNFTSRVSPAGAGIVSEDRIFTSSLGSTTASANMSAALTKGAIIAAVIRAAAAATGQPAMRRHGHAPHGLEGVRYYRRQPGGQLLLPERELILPRRRSILVPELKLAS